MAGTRNRLSQFLRNPPLGHPAAWLVTAGITLVIYAGAFGLPFFLGNHYAVPQLTWVSMVGYRLDLGVLYTLVIVALFALYYLGYRALRAHQALPVWAVYLPPVAFALVLLAIYPPDGWDLFLYISQGRLFAVHGLNPFLVTPQDASADPFFSYSSWWPYPSTYGPVWQMTASLLSILGGQSLWLSMVVFKVAVTAFFFGAVVLVYLILRQHRPEVRHAGAYLLAWNPLLLFEIAGNGHNDIVMVFFALLAIYLLAQKRFVWPLPMVAISALVKYSSVVLIPGILVFLWSFGKSLRQRLLWTAGGIGLSAIAVLLFARPFGMAYSLFALFGLEELYRSSIATVLYLSLQGNFPQYEATNITKGLVFLGLGIACLVELVRLARTARPGALESLLDFSYQVTFFFLVFIPRFHPWFVVWLMGLGVLLVATEQMKRAILLSFTAFLSHIVYYFIGGIYADRINNFTLESIGAALVFGPPLFYWLHSRSTVRRGLLVEKDRIIGLQTAEIDRLKAQLPARAKAERTKLSPR